MSSCGVAVADVMGTFKRTGSQQGRMAKTEIERERGFYGQSIFMNINGFVVPIPPPLLGYRFPAIIH